MKYNQPVFIVSTGRAGSKMIARTLAVLPKVFAVHEPKPHLNTEAFGYWKKSHSNDKIRDKIIDKRSDLIDQVQGNQLFYIESSHYCSHLVQILDELYDAKFIHLYRDGRNFVRSGLQRRTWYPNHSNKAPVEERVKEYLRRILRRNLLLDVGNSWDDHKLIPPNKYATRVEKISWLWVEINSIIINSLSELPKNKYTSIKLETFNKSGVEKVLEFLQLNPASDSKQKMKEICTSKPNQTNSKRIQPFDKWNQKDQHSFWSIAEDMMQTLQYI